MKKKILLADDSITIQKIVELTLSDTYDIRCVGDGNAAVAALQEFRPDLMLCDAVMPAKNGYDVCAHVKSVEGGRIPVIMLHGTFETFDAGKAKQAGADAVMSKPFDTQALLEQIQALLSAPPAPAAEYEMPAAESVEAASIEARVDDAFSAFGEPPVKESAPPAETEQDTRLAEAPLETEAERTMAFSSEDLAKMMQRHDFGGASGTSAAGREEAMKDLEAGIQSVELPAAEAKSAETEIRQEPEAYYEKPEGMTDEDKQFAREMARESSVPLEEMLPADIAPAAAPEESPAAMPPSAAEEMEEEKVSLDVQEMEAEEESAPPAREDMPTAELLSDLGPSATAAAPAASLNEKAVEEIVERVLRRVVEKMVRDIVWEVVPDMAELHIRKKIEEIEKAVEQHPPNG
jgi:CheY-like chemotaxis protein